MLCCCMSRSLCCRSDLRLEMCCCSSCVHITSESIEKLDFFANEFWKK
jgi:hypothetical protein